MKKLRETMKTSVSLSDNQTQDIAHPKQKSLLFIGCAFYPI